MSFVKKKKSEVTRERIIVEAIRAFARDGYSTVSIQKIADASHVAQTAVLYHFKSKLGLFEESLSYCLSTMTVESAFLPSDNAWQRLCKYFEVNLEWAVQYPEQAQIFIMLYYLASYERHFSEIYGRIRSSAQSRILSIVLAGQREQLFHFREPAQGLAVNLHGLAVGGIINFISDVDRRADRKHVGELTRSWRASLAKLTGYTGES